MAKTSIPNFHWRDGRPRWIPGPTIRARGYAARDLKDREGKFLSRGAAIEEAERLNAMVRDGAKLPAQPKARTMAALFDALRARPKMQGRKDGAATPRRSPAEKLKLAGRTRAGYLLHLRLLEKWCGHVSVGALTPAAIEDFYAAMAEHRGLAMANATLRVGKLAMNYGLKVLRWREIESNPFCAVQLASTDGRLVMYTPEEFNTLVAAADYVGLASMGDAITLAALTGQRKADLLTLPAGDLSAGYYTIMPKKTARKTGHRAFVPLSRPLVVRIEAMRRRKAEAWPGVRHTIELVSTQTGAPYHPGAKEFDEEFRMVRAIAGGVIFAIEDLFQIMAGMEPRPRNLPFVPAPTVLGKRFADFRDTAVTWLFAAGCTEAEIANITAHSLKTVTAILEKHYFVRNEALAQSARPKLEGWLARSNIGG